MAIRVKLPFLRIPQAHLPARKDEQVQVQWETAEEGRDICGPPLPLLFGAGQALARWGLYNHPLITRQQFPQLEAAETLAA